MIDFEWNGEKASEHGVIVTSLAPITKAPKRTEVIEIDGRDGDIIIDKGFQAYDKEVQIGLAKNYDLNWLMNWLNGSGQVTFSNEPDVFYNAEIVNQIDFERLVSFKIATISFHVQPFKYLKNETKVTKTFASSDTKKITVENKGLIDSKPIMTITGKGTIGILVNNFEVCTIVLGSESDETSSGHMTLDSIQEEAYEDTITNLKNRKMLGKFPILKSGTNEITFVGNITSVEIFAKSRWF